MNIADISNLNPEQALKELKKNAEPQKETSFSDVLTRTIGELNDTQIKADKAVADLASGEVTDLHEAAIAIGKAELSMNLMLEIRNKAISAYKEISRTQL